jgi:hypothetical protein
MSFFSLFEKNKPSVAFSLDNGNVRWVSVLRQKEGVQVMDYGSLELGSEIIGPTDEILDDAAFVNRLRTIVPQINNGYGNPEANIVIPDHRAIMFHTHVAKNPVKEMGDVIIDHIKTYCGSHDLLLLAEYICEYDVILETEFGYDIHVTLVPKLYSSHLARLFKQSGIAIRHVETAHHAVATACLDIPAGKGAVLVSFGTKQSTIALLHADHLISQEIIPVGMNNLYHVIERFLGVDHAYAKKIIDRHGILQTHPDNGLLGELYLELAPIYRSIDRQLISIGRMPYKTYGHRFVTNTLVVYGEGLSVKGLTLFLGERSGLEVHDLDVWAGREHDRARIMNLPASETLIYAEALSLALLYLK